MMKPKIIKTDFDYQTALAHLETLMDAQPGTPEEEELELFAVLIENYEQEHFPIGLPDPIAAIQFRMEQQGLTRKDLIPFIGSQSKVSEVLNKKRPLSLGMIRALYKGLGIPAEVLLQEPGRSLAEPKYDMNHYPFAEMFNRGYFMFTGTLQQAKECAEELLEQLFAPLKGHVPEPVYCRYSDGQMDEFALAAWQARVLALAEELDLPPYTHKKLTPEFVRDVVKLSNLSQGPVLAKELLQKRGIPLVVLPHLPQTYLDGACFKSPDGRPIIGLTLRHDRLDNFWFTLVHELAHIHRHLENGDLVFFDDTEQGTQHSCNQQEIEANQLTSDWLISLEAWNQEGKTLNSKIRIEAFAEKLGISSAIVVGRVRWYTDNYTHFSQMLGHRTVKKLFANEN